MSGAATTAGVVRTQVGHDDLIHDAQLDYYGLRLATCSSDRVVKVFDVRSENGAAPKVEFSCDLLGHTGPVWEIAWAHPRFGTLLASCSYDASVIIHRQSANGTWEQEFRYAAKGSINSIEWAPFEYGLALACASSDGHVHILRCNSATGEWSLEKSFMADKAGCNSVTWAPYGALGSLTPDGNWIMRLATAGSDSTVKIWKCEMNQDSALWAVESPEHELRGHSDWVRDVAWAPSIGLPYNLLASCSEDGSVIIWSQETENGEWKGEKLPKFNAPVWRVSWSVTGSLLAVSSGDSDVTLWKESLENNKWMKVSEVKDDKATSSDSKSQPAPLAPVSASTSVPSEPLEKEAGTAEQKEEEIAPITQGALQEPRTAWEGAEVSETGVETTTEWQQQQPSEEWQQQTEQQLGDQQQWDLSQQYQYDQHQYQYDQQQQQWAGQEYDQQQWTGQEYDQQQYDQAQWDQSQYADQGYDQQQYADQQQNGQQPPPQW